MEQRREREFYGFVPMRDDGILLLDFLASRYSRFDRSGWKDAIEKGKIRVEGAIITSPLFPLKKHARISYFPGELPEPEADPTFRVHYEDEFFLVLEKSGNLCVHPTGPFYKNTLWYQASSLFGELRFVQRLDKETSGLLLAARSREAAAAVNNGRTLFHKEYLVLVHGDFHGTVHAKGRLVRDERSSVGKKKRFLFADNSGNTLGESAETILVRERAVPPGMTLVRALPVTGRQHQIRATLFSLGFPVAGDKLYGRDENLFRKISKGGFTEEEKRLLILPRQALHCAVLRFVHPFTGREISCSCEADFGGQAGVIPPPPLSDGHRSCTPSARSLP
ncbi:MAG: RluA family pseudouridine synthase [Lentisphaeria bacterium]|nr:RluA family pseudouridine synthase [Lentisphaeria bacterium]